MIMNVLEWQVVHYSIEEILLKRPIKKSGRPWSLNSKEYKT